MSFNAERALKSRAILLGGEEEILVRRALQDLLRVVAPEGDDFDLITLDADAATPEEWFAAAGTAPFLAERRTCLVRHLLRCDEPERFLAAKLPEYALVILIADEESGDDRKQQKLSLLRGKWEKWILQHKGFVEIFKSDSKGLPAILRKEAETLGATLSPPAASLLAEMVGGSLSRGLGELEKLVLYCGEGAPIGEKTVREVAVPSRDWNVFKLVECVAAGDVAGAMQQLQILVGSPTKAEDAAYGNVFPQMHRQLRLLWQARLIVEARVSSDNLPTTVRALMPDRPSFSKEPPFRQSKLLAVARQTSLPSLAACFELVSRADAKLKGMLPAFSATETLEEMLLLLVRELRPAAVA